MFLSRIGVSRRRDARFKQNRHKRVEVIAIQQGAQAALTTRPAARSNPALAAGGGVNPKPSVFIAKHKVSEQNRCFVWAGRSFSTESAQT